MTVAVGSMAEIRSCETLSQMYYWPALPDGWERDHPPHDPTNPNDGQQDADGDGVSDGREWANGTDSSLTDSDGDGLSDLAEWQWGFDGANADANGNGVDDGWEDQDGDGQTSRVEAFFGGDPWNAALRAPSTAMTVTGGEEADGDAGEETGQAASAGQGLKGAADGDGNDRDLEFRGEGGEGSLELAEAPVLGAGSLGEDQQVAAIAQGLGHHLEGELHVAADLDDDNVAVAGEPFEEPVDDMLALGVVVGPVQEGVGKEHRDEKPVDVGLVVGDEDTGALGGEVSEAVGAHAAGKMSDADLHEPEGVASPGAGACGGTSQARRCRWRNSVGVRPVRVLKTRQK